MRNLTAVDLFAGGGGLTVGLKRAGFRIEAAVEFENNAYDTYVANHRDVRAYLQDIRTVRGSDLTRLTASGRIDLLSGCPPCQGFTSLTSKYKKRDQRNALIDEMARIIAEVRPAAVMMENVPGLAIRGKWRFEKFLRDLKKLGYMPTVKVLQVADYGVPQFRRRLVVLAGLGFEVPMPKPTHSRAGKDGLPRWRTVRDAISGMPTPVRFGDLRKKRASPQSTDWHIVRSISQENEARLRAAKPGQEWWKIPSKLRPNCHKGAYRGFGNVYGRMKWDDVSPTITGGCTTLSKGRFGHPQANRTISIREAALLQTFPQDYLFDTSRIDQACNIIGNALPCEFATVLARQCRIHIERAKKNGILQRLSSRARKKSRIKRNVTKH